VKTVRSGVWMALLGTCAWVVPGAWSQDQNVAAPTASISAAPISPAQVPRLVRFSGGVLDESGKPRTGVTGLTFLFYKDQSGGAPLWMETQNVTLDARGHYSVLLGASKPDGLPTDLFAAGEARWVAVQPAGEAEQPRVLLLSVPYALKAMDAETLGGRPVSDFALSSSQAGNAPIVTSATPQAVATSGNAVSQTTGLASITGNGTKNFIPIWTSSSVLGNSTIFETGGKVGIGTTTPGAFELVANAPNQLGEQIEGPFAGVGAGLQLQTTGTGGKGWELLASGKTSAQGPSKLNIRDLSSAADVFTIAPGGLVGINKTNPGTVLQVTDNNVPCCAVGTVIAADAFKVGTAVFGDVTGTSGLSDGVFGQIFSPVTGSAAVVGEAQGTLGQTSGVAGFNRSSGRFAAGIVAAEEANSGFTLGVSAVSDSPNGAGVLGLGQGMSNTGNNLIGCCAFGVWGDTRSNVFGDAALIGTADDARAIYLQNNSTSVPTAFMFQGAANQLALQAGGNGGFCTIDSNGHENCPNGFSMTAAVASGARRVALYAMESPQHWFEDFGAGRLENGTAAVALDPTFAQTVNGASDYHVFLTPEGDCRGLYVSRKTASGFEVRELGGGRSTVAFDYRIVALRRGFENVRLEDVTDQWNKMNTSMPTPTPGPRFKTPSAPPAPVVAAQANNTGGTQLRAER
jgi:hypothetical protein